MDIIAQQIPKGFSPASRSRLGMVLFHIKDEESKSIDLKISGDSLKAQLNKYNFDIIDMKAKHKDELN